MNTFAIGPIRPPFHAESLLLQVTENCPWNRCNFCTLYRGGQFRVRSVEDVKKDIDAIAAFRDKIEQYRKPDGQISHQAAMAAYQMLSNEWEQECFAMVYRWMVSDGMRTVFLQDANTMVLQAEKLAEMVAYLRKKLPSVTLVAAYGRADTLCRISPADFALLKESGLTMIHSGYESGSDNVLKLINKGSTQAQQIEAGLKVKEAGFEFNVFYMPGSGGRPLSEENAAETAKVINAIDPDYVRIRTFVVKEDAPMWLLQQEGKFEECTDLEKVQELRQMIASLHGCTGYLISDHIINLLSGVEGFVRSDKEKILSYIDRFLALPQQEQKEFQLARRMCVNVDYDEMALLPENYRDQIRSLVRRADTAEKWEETLRYYLRKYI